MGRFAKNTIFDSGSYALGLAATSSSFRPNVAGFTSQTALRYSTSSDKLEYYSHAGNVWQTVGNVGSGTARITKDTFSGNALTSDYGPLSFNYNTTSPQLWAANILVHVGTVYQIPGTNYEFAANAISGTDIRFASNPSDSAIITIIHGLNSTIAS
jgi:hypothetical protein